MPKRLKVKLEIPAELAERVIKAKEAIPRSSAQSLEEFLLDLVKIGLEEWEKYVVEVYKQVSADLELIQRAREERGGVSS